MLARGGIAFAAKFRRAAPRRAAPRSMRADPAMVGPCHVDPMPCHASKFGTRGRRYEYFKI